MRIRHSQRDINRLLSGSVPQDDDLAQLVPLTKALRSLAEHTPSEANVHRIATETARIALAASQKARTGAETTVTPPAPAPRTRRGTLKPRFAGALVAVIIAFSATAGVAYAANGAAPGDTLYGFDLALERVGLGAGGLRERLSEADSLAQSGDVQTGLDHALDALAADGLANESARQAGVALSDTYSQLTDLGQEPAAATLSLVTQMLHWMAATDPTGSDFVQGVTERTGEITRSAAQGTSGDPAGNGSTTTSTVPPGANPQGQSDGPGRPDTTNGPPDTGGQP